MCGHLSPKDCIFDVVSPILKTNIYNHIQCGFDRQQGTQ